MEAMKQPVSDSFPFSSPCPFTDNTSDTLKGPYVPTAGSLGAFDRIGSERLQARVSEGYQELHLGMPPGHIVYCLKKQAANQTKGRKTGPMAYQTGAEFRPAPPSPLPTRLVTRVHLILGALEITTCGSLRSLLPRHKGRKLVFEERTQETKLSSKNKSLDEF